MTKIIKIENFLIKTKTVQMSLLKLLYMGTQNADKK